MTILYIVGNGFDRHHGMATRYQHFAGFLEQRHPQISTLLDEYLPTCEGDDFWNYFEERLAEFDAETLVENSEQFIVPYGAEDWSDAYHHDYGYELDKVVCGLSEDLLEAFAQWVHQIEVPRYLDATLKARIDPRCRFISFNYTDTL